jgi:hypothetical protein
MTRTRTGKNDAIVDVSLTDVSLTEGARKGEEEKGGRRGELQ